MVCIFKKTMSVCFVLLFIHIIFFPEENKSIKTMRLVQTYPLADIIKVQKALLRIKSGKLCCVSASTILKKLQSFQNAYKTW